MFDRYMIKAGMIPVNPSDYDFNTAYRKKTMHSGLNSYYKWKSERKIGQNFKSEE